VSSCSETNLEVEELASLNSEPEAASIELERAGRQLASLRPSIARKKKYWRMRLELSPRYQIDHGSQHIGSIFSNVSRDESRGLEYLVTTLRIVPPFVTTRFQVDA